MEFIDLKAQYKQIKASVDRRMQAVLDHAQFIMGPEIKELEDKLAAFTGSKHCISCASGTDALMLAMMALNIGAGDEVVTSPFTFIATAEMIALLGAKPVFVDICADNYNLDPELLARAITPRTKAIMPVSLYGQCADMDAINEVAGGIPVIEDAAQSFGAKYHGQMSCNLSTIGCTSFFPSKPLGCYGDGGACFTNDDVLATKMKQIRVHGQDRRYHHPVIGFNGRLDTLQAAVLLAKFDVFEQEIQQRERVATSYKKHFDAAVQTPRLRPYCTSVYAQYTIEVDHRDEVQDTLKSKGVPTAVHYPVPLHLQPAFAFLGQGVGAFPVSERAAQRVMSLPMHPYMPENEIEQVTAAVKECTQLSVTAAPGR
ncbi:DegT/DnrJ/EryC1/StrS aminotransferase [Candidatus Koribacter versatilis Ellin345]|uniref:DegT/DnrJ/EryC1/StrS aminotransferase n=1 Tax=Koribacter versatilis (strain Ellin345) TaxID=204669 RepID=Q1ILD6_KORVE|nr:DegT/DnrJ/EryC1/StrS family aminotransferase [Candidatus Koribacter versatilis]ABF42314.1 DegT/DnrJ/EryC1/StrS aminotransferase [Candidatus Koribacter versatilis Ellin345]